MKQKLLAFLLLCGAVAIAPSHSAWAQDDRYSHLHSIAPTSFEKADIAANNVIIEREMKRNAERIAAAQQQQQQNRPVNHQGNANKPNVSQRYDTSKTYMDRIPKPERLFNNIR